MSPVLLVQTALPFPLTLPLTSSLLLLHHPLTPLPISSLAFMHLSLRLSVRPSSSSFLLPSFLPPGLLCAAFFLFDVANPSAETVTKEEGEEEEEKEKEGLNGRTTAAIFPELLLWRKTAASIWG